MRSFRTLDDVDVKGRRVLLRVDLNVPVQNGEVADASRIERLVPTITEIADKGGKVILVSHYGRPHGPDPEESLKPIVAAAAKVIGRPIGFAADCIGPVAEKAVAAMQPGDILCLENTRFHKGETKNDPDFAKQLARLGDIYVADAFSVAHRAHATVEAIAHLLPAYAGRAVQEELAALRRALLDPERPVTAIVGGAKVSTKLDLLSNLIDQVETLIIAGGMANTFLAAQGKAVGKSLCETDLIPTAREIMAKAKSLNREILLPVDAVVATKFAAHAPSRVVGVDEVGPDEMILDIGPRSIEQTISVLARSKTLVWNGPFGAFEMEPFDNGTVEVAEAAAELTADKRLVSIAGGGDTMAALNVAGVTERLTYVSTAGGAFLEWLEGKKLPGIEVLQAERTPAVTPA
jgi:phosphoglycerate kinase